MLCSLLVLPLPSPSPAIVVEQVEFTPIDVATGEAGRYFAFCHSSRAEGPRQVKNEPSSLSISLALLWIQLSPCLEIHKCGLCFLVGLSSAKEVGMDGGQLSSFTRDKRVPVLETRRPQGNGFFSGG